MVFSTLEMVKYGCHKKRLICRCACLLQHLLVRAVTVARQQFFQRWRAVSIRKDWKTQNLLCFKLYLLYGHHRWCQSTTTARTRRIWYKTERSALVWLLEIGKSSISNKYVLMIHNDYSKYSELYTSPNTNLEEAALSIINRCALLEP